MNPQAAATAALACVGCVSYLGLDFRPAPVLIACLAAILVRVPLFNARTRIAPEASFILLGMLGAFVSVVDHHLGPGLAFGAGVVSGAVAGTMRELGKAIFTSAIRQRIMAAARLLAGVPQPPEPAPRPPSDPADAAALARLWEGEPPNDTPGDMTDTLNRIP